MAGDAGQHVQPCPAADIDVDLMRPELQRARHRERERRLAELGRIDAEEQMVHDRIADEDAVENVVAVDVAFLADLADQPVDRLAHGLGHGFAPVRVHHHVGDAAHQILAEADLRVRRAGRGGDAAGQQRHQVHGDGRRADVAGDAVSLVLEAGPQADDEGARGIHVAVDRRGDAPIALAQHGLHLRDDMRSNQQVLPAPVLFQHGFQPVEIAERLVHVGLVDLDVAELHRGVALDDAVGCRLAHDLRVDHRVLRHVDDEIAEDQRRAGEAAAFGQAAHALVALFLRALWRDVFVGGHDLVLGEIALLHLDLAASAGGAAAAHALDIDAERTRGIEDRRADGKAAALAGRHEKNERIADFGIHGCKCFERTFAPGLRVRCIIGGSIGVSGGHPCPNSCCLRS